MFFFGQTDRSFSSPFPPFVRFRSLLSSIDLRAMPLRVGQLVSATFTTGQRVRRGVNVNRDRARELVGPRTAARPRARLQRPVVHNRLRFAVLGLIQLA